MPQRTARLGHGPRADPARGGPVIEQPPHGVRLADFRRYPRLVAVAVRRGVQQRAETVPGTVEHPEAETLGNRLGGECTTVFTEHDEPDDRRARRHRWPPRPTTGPEALTARVAAPAVHRPARTGPGRPRDGTSVNPAMAPPLERALPPIDARLQLESPGVCIRLPRSCWPQGRRLTSSGPESCHSGRVAPDRGSRAAPSAADRGGRVALASVPQAVRRDAQAQATTRTSRATATAGLSRRSCQGRRPFPWPAPQTAVPGSSPAAPPGH
jgi:hypothetical protein